jgi:glycosyltransferase involved in cell wall biosynthesis
MISICIPTYNGERYLEQCLNSAVAQTYKDIEIVICDDCSTDKSWNIIQNYAAKYPQIRATRNAANLGLVGNWNNCIKQAKGEWIKFLFQDDYLAEECIDVMVKAISPDNKMVVSARNYVFEEDVDQQSREYALNKTLTLAKLGINAKEPVHVSSKLVSEFAVQKIRMNFIGEPTNVMFKKDIVAELGEFNTDLIQICDLEYFLRIATKYGLKYIPQPLTYFRGGAHKGSTSRTNITKRLYEVNYIDPLIMISQMLSSDVFSNFRKMLGVMQNMKLKMFFSVYAYEAYTIAKKETGDELNAFNAASKKYPSIEMHKQGTFGTHLLRILLDRK